MTASSQYTKDEIEEFAAAQKCTVEEFSRRWVIQSGGAYWLHGPRGYKTPIRSKDLQVAMRDTFAAAKNTEEGVRLTYLEKDKKTEEEREVNRRVEAILLDHATVAFKVAASMSVPSSYFDPSSGTFHEQVCPMRYITPAYDEQVDTWLRLLGGIRGEKLLDWVATVTLLDRPTCLIYLHGPKDTGKTLLAAGLARLWADTPTDMADLVAPFNSGIADCPIILADEKIPKNMDSGDLRSFIGRTSHTLRRKGIPNVPITGCLRGIIAANQPDLLKFDKEDFAKEDIDAIASRILYIPVDPKAKEYIDSLGGISGGTSDWVTGDKIAAHALWLATNRKVVPGKRFLVEGQIETFHRRLATHGTIRGLVVEWICKAILKPIWQPDENENIGIRFGHGKLFVNSAFVHDHWEIIDKKIPSTDKIGKALAPLSLRVKRFTVSKPKKDARRVDFYEIGVDDVYRVAEEFQIGIAETYKARIEKKRWNWTCGTKEEDGDEPEEPEEVSAAPAVAPVPHLTSVPPSSPQSLFDRYVG